MRNTPTPFHASFFAFRNPSHSTLGSHKAPKPLFMLHFSVSKPFPPHSWEPWSTQPCFHASFLAFPDPSHPTLGNHEAPKPFFMLHFAPSQALPTPLLGTVNLFLMLQTLPTPLLGTMRNTHPLFHVSLKGVGSSAAAIAFVDQRNLQQQKFPSFPPHSWEPWSTQIPFHASFLAGPFPPHAWEPWSTQTLFSCFILGLPRPFPPHAWEPWSTQTLFHASFFSFPSFSHPTLGNHEKRQNPFSCFIVSFPKPFPPHSWEPWLHELWLSFPPSQVCMYIYIYIYTHIHTYIHACMHACMHTYIHTYIRTYIHTYTYVRTYIYVHIYIYPHIHWLWTIGCEPLRNRKKSSDNSLLSLWHAEHS